MFSDQLLNQTLNKLKTLTPEDFVTLIAEHLKLRDDFSDVRLGPPKGPDKGIDIIAKMLSPTGEFIGKVSFQCKHYVVKTLGRAAITDTVSGMLSADAVKGILVSTRVPSQSARDAINDWQQKRGIQIDWEEWCERSLVSNIIKKTPSILVRRFPELRSQIPFDYLCPSFEIVLPHLNGEGSKADKFYNGYPPTWLDLIANFDIERKVYVRKPNGIQERVSKLLDESNGLKIISLVGVAGTGKTTLLRRMGLDMAMKGHLVLRLRDDWIFYNLSLSKQIKDVVEARGSGLLVLIDDASNLVSEKNILEGTLREIESLQSVVLVLVEQPGPWSLAVRKIPLFVEGENYFEYGIHHLFLSECEELVDRILQYEENGTLSYSCCKLPRAERLDLCREVAERQLVVAMLQMRHGIRFCNIIEREYDRIPMEEGKNAYAMVCYFNTYGVPLPSTLLMRLLNISMPVTVQQFQNSIEGLFIENRLGLSARHTVIAKTVARHALQSPDARKAALKTVLSAIDLNEQNEERIFLRIFTGENMYRHLVNQLHRDSNLVRSLYDDIRTSYNPLPPYFLKFIATSQALAERILKSPDKARTYFKEAIQLDPMYAFACRQHAWLEHTEGNWDEAAELAIHAAELDSENFLCVYHCGRILSLNTVRNFYRAESYLKRAAELEPHDPKIIKRLDDYQEAKRMLGYLEGLKNDELIRKLVFEKLRPGLAFIRAHYGCKLKDAMVQLEKDLKQMQEDTRGDLSDLLDKINDMGISNIEDVRKNNLKALIICNMARLQYLEWRNGDGLHDLSEMEQLFKNSLKLNIEDPFTHCWYGTFLKEVRGDFTEALSEYEKALSYGNQSKSQYLHEHPLFINNIALLIMDEVQNGLRKADFLKESKSLLEKAVAKVKETKSNFFWPAYNLSLCIELMREDSATKD